MVIAIDGPAGSGKSTVAHRIAEMLHITFLNSGSFYRAITLALLRAGSIDIRDSAPHFLQPQDAIVSFVQALQLEYRDAHLILNGEDVEELLHSDIIDACASPVSAIVPVRHIVNIHLRKIAQTMSIVCEGRDMTTVVFPDADYKFYLDASIDVQAERRFKQGVSNLSFEEIKARIQKRDALDRHKAEGSLKIAGDAVYIDTSDLTIEQVCEIIIHKIHV